MLAGGGTLTNMIDLRSDTVSQPTDSMKRAMSAAPLGDDAYRDDPTANRLEESVAELLGKEASVFVTSATQSNLCAVLAQCQRGDQYVLAQGSHNQRFEAGGTSVLGGIVAQPVPMQADETMKLDDVDQRIITDSHNYHFAVSKLLCLENTTDGRVLQPSYVDAIQTLAAQRGLNVHLDGARLWNAAVASRVSPSEIAHGFNSVTVCLSKGLGAPAGAVLAGSTELVEEARRWRKMLGGGLRQTGMLAAAGLYAIDHHLERLATDHENAAILAAGLQDNDAVTVTAQDTNMVFLDVDPSLLANLSECLTNHGINATVDEKMRLVTHLGVSRADIDLTIKAFGKIG